MGRYILRRISQSILVLVGVSIICFTMFQYMGDPALALVGMDATNEQLAEVSKLLGLDQPVYWQYARFLGRTLHGDFGISYMTRTPALKVVLQRLPADWTQIAQVYGPFNIVFADPPYDSSDLPELADKCGSPEKKRDKGTQVAEADVDEEGGGFSSEGPVERTGTDAPGSGHRQREDPMRMDSQWMPRSWTG